MKASWQIVAFPLILPWRKEFWTLPVYFPNLQVGVPLNWPEAMPYQGKPLPPEAHATLNELRHYHPGDLLQRKAFQDFLESGEEVQDIIRELKGLPQEALPEGLPQADAWTLVWQMEKMQAYEETRMIQVDQGEKWLAEILSPEPWDNNRQSYGTTGLKEMMDPELAQLRYLLWRREMAPYLTEHWAPFLLGRTSRAIFASLKGWPGWNLIKSVQVKLPGVRSETAWRELTSKGKGPDLRGFEQHLAACLAAAGDYQALIQQTDDFKEYLEKGAPAWPGEPDWFFDLEIWAHEGEEDTDWGPVLCWSGAGADILPG